MEGLEQGPRTEGQKGRKWRKNEYFGLGAIELLGVRNVFFFYFCEIWRNRRNGVRSQ